MTHTLFIGDPAYSSWSLRAWLLFDRTGLPVDLRHVGFSTGPVADQLARLPELGPARTVPTLLAGDGAVISESLAIAEEIASRAPDAGLWPAAALARATARNLAAEMHAGFAALRGDCPMNLRTAYAGFAPSDAVRRDLDRIALLWDHARAIARSEEIDGPWLLGRWSVADAFYAPVAARIAGYGLPVPDAARAYVELVLADPSFRRWRAMGQSRGGTLDRYAMPHVTRPWPGPDALPAAPSDGPAENDACPFTGASPAHCLKMAGRDWGFATPALRDQAMADPAAWPQVVAMTGIDPAPVA